MRGTHPLRRPFRHLPLTLLAAASLYGRVLALPQQVVTTAAPAPSPWVTVDDLGGAQTITPKVITTEGHITTLSQVPGSLLSTATYTISPNGRASTYTGLAPVAAATGSGSHKGGVFLACHVNKGVDAPFCQPRRGAELVQGRTYYITWDPSYFQSSAPQNVQLQASYGGTSSGPGFTSDPIPASRGYHVWAIPADFLSGSDSLAVTFSLAHDDPDTPEADRITIPGPEVFVVAASSSSDGDPTGHNGGGTSPAGNGTNILAIVLPVILVAVLIGLGAFCFLSYRKHGAVPLMGAALKRRSTTSGGYGARQSRSGRVGAGAGAGVGQGRDQGPYAGATGDNKSETNIGVELTDRDSWSPTARSSAGRNVFREEVERQERAARGER